MVLRFDFLCIPEPPFVSLTVPTAVTLLLFEKILSLIHAALVQPRKLTL